MKRLCLRLQRARCIRPEEVAIPVETAPGEVAQVDFGYVGRLYDPDTRVLRKSHVFVLVLGYSRHLVCRLVFDQRIETFLQSHAEAFATLGGPPSRSPTIGRRPSSAPPSASRARRRSIGATGSAPAYPSAPSVTLTLPGHRGARRRRTGWCRAGRQASAPCSATGVAAMLVALYHDSAGGMIHGYGSQLAYNNR